LAHVYKACKLNTPWTISESIRTYGPESFTQEIIEVVRGKANAFAKEANLINLLQPELNTRKITEPNLLTIC